MSYKNRESCAKKLKLSFEDVKNTFESHNCILLSSEDDYVNESSKLKYICVCGNTHTKIFRDYKHKDWRCPSCVKKELAKTNAIKNGYGFDDINKLFKNHGFVLETIKEYYNQKDRITYHCENHHKNTKLLSTYKKNPICIECNKELDRRKRWNDILDFASVYGLEIVSSYDSFIDCYSKISVRCKCGNIYNTVVNEFKHGNKLQCNNCGIQLKSGENSHMWKGGITTENETIRKSRKYINWRKKVFERDSYTCQCCGDSSGGNLQAHHIKNFSEFPDIRFELDNGITLCNKCHDFNQIGSFHHTYGSRNNTPEQLYEYIENYKKLHKESTTDSLLLCSNK